MTDAQSAQTALDKLIEAVEAGNATEFQFHTWRPGLTGTIKESKAMLRAYNGSLDAALALHEALLPRWKYSLSNDLMQHGGPCEPAAVWDGMGNYSGGFADEAVIQPARAWLLAILRAYRSLQQ